jgi:hypothetical protein
MDSYAVIGPPVVLALPNPLFHTLPVPARYAVHVVDRQSAIFDNMRGTYTGGNGAPDAMAVFCVQQNRHYREWIEWSRQWTLRRAHGSD